MKNKTILFALLMIILTSCNNKPSTNSTAEIASKINQPSTCYSYSKDSNNILMQIAIEDNIVKGDLLIEYYQKDKNKGKIYGEMKGDTMYAEYTFMSEGVNSTREVAFLKKGNEMTEGFGDVEEKSGKMVFKNKATLKFESKISLTKTECIKDEHGSLLSFGYKWSSIKNSSVQIGEIGAQLNPMKLKIKKKVLHTLFFLTTNQKLNCFYQLLQILFYLQGKEQKVISCGQTRSLNF